MVPKEWTVVSKVAQLLWTDEGTGGRAGSLWTINRIGLFAAVSGHKAPGAVLRFQGRPRSLYWIMEEDVDGAPKEEVINPLEAAKEKDDDTIAREGEADMEKMLAMMKRKSLARTR